MLKFWLRSPLFEEAPPDGAPGGGGNPPPVAFDPVAFKADILGEFNKGINAIAKQLKAIKPDPPAPPPPADPPNPGDGNDLKNMDPALAAEIRALRRQNKELTDVVTTIKTESQQTKAEAETKELQSILRTKLAKFKLADESAQGDAFEIFAPKVKRDEEGRIVGHDGTPLDQYLDEQLKTRQYLFAPKDVGGAGARNGGRGNGGTRTFSLEDIDNIKNLSAEDQAKLRSQIGAQMSAAQTGR